MVSKRGEQSHGESERERLVAATAWFVSLASAKVRNQFAEAAEAQAELERLGVTVRFRRPRSRSV